MRYHTTIENLLDNLARLPGIGPKSAQRIAYWLLASQKEDAEKLAHAILEVTQTVHFCPTCFDFAVNESCEICSDTQRDTSLLCVVEEPRDVMAIERTGQYRGYYHVLHGAISPMDGVGPEDLRVAELMGRLSSSEISEVVIATNPNIEGEATSAYLARLIKPLAIKVTRLASGLPVGGDLEYADEVTLSRALEARREI